MMKVIAGRDWPDDIEMLTEYHIYGEPKIAEAMEEIAIDIVKKHGGFWRDDIPRMSELTETSHESIGLYMGMGTLHSARVVNGGMGFKLVPLDPMVPNSRLVEAYSAILEHEKKIMDGKSYPALTGKMFIFEPGSAIPGELGYTKLWIVLSANWKMWDDETRKDFKIWFKDYAEIVWSFDAALTGTHGFIPSDIRPEILKRELGGVEYELIKRMKKALDPKNIMNPKVGI
jgi:FAD/FMN-containing dehydrogenase